MDAYTGEIRAVGFNFAPRGWALCAGQLMPISQNTALFSILGITYGGDGRSTFALPNLCGRAIINAGQGMNLTSYSLGATVGSESVTLDITQLPPHIHTLSGTLAATDADAGSTNPTNNYPATAPVPQYGEAAGGSTMGPNIVQGNAGPSGGSGSHDNMMPYQTLNYIICLAGIYPPRS